MDLINNSRKIQSFEVALTLHLYWAVKKKKKKKKERRGSKLKKQKHQKHIYLHFSLNFLVMANIVATTATATPDMMNIDFSLSFFFLACSSSLPSDGSYSSYAIELGNQLG